ncbi:Hypothetical predicted protein, partial [Paramuricea clavata]
QIILPPGGNSLIVLNGSTVRIEWSIDGSVSSGNIIFRSWVFIRSGKTERLGEISGAGKITITTKLYEVDIKEPATLILKNVNGSYNGKYTFTLLSPGNSISEVDVVIAG